MDINSTVLLHTNNKMPVIGLGTWQLIAGTAETVKKALKLGYRMIDTSGDYGNQTGIGQGIKDSGIKREELYLVTKVEEDEDAYEAAAKNLEELGTDYADLILIHRPPATGIGQALWEGLIRAKKEGLTRDIGVSNYAIEQIQDLTERTGELPAVNQVEWSPFGYSSAMLTYAAQKQIVIQAYSPLTRTKRLDDQVLKDTAHKHGKTPAQILIRWNLEVGTVPLPKSSRDSHLQENIDVFDFHLDEDDMKILNSLNEHYSVFGSLQYL